MAFIFVDGLLTSAFFGVVLSFGIIFLSPHANQVTDDDEMNPSFYTLSPPSGSSKSLEGDSTSKQTRKLVNILGVSNAELAKSLREEFTVRKSKKIQRVLGISESDIRVAAREMEYMQSRVESYVINKTRKLQKVLGMDEDDIRCAFRNKSGNHPTSDSEFYMGSTSTAVRDKNNDRLQPEEPANWFKILDGFVIISLIAVFCYFFNHSTNGDFGRVLAGLFPREFKALGLKEYLEKVSSTDPRFTA